MSSNLTIKLITEP